MTLARKAALAILLVSLVPILVLGALLYFAVDTPRGLLLPGAILACLAAAAVASFTIARTIGGSADALERSERQFRSVTQFASDAIISADSAGIIRGWNHGAARIFGYREEEIVGRPLADLMPERYREAHRQGLARLSATGEARILGKTLEVHGLRKSGQEFPMELCVDSWRTPEGRFFSGVMRDITDRKRVEDEVLALNRELEAFTYSVSHDLRAPLRAIDGFARILGDEHPGQLTDEGRRLLGVITDNARQMGKLIDDLLEFSRAGRAAIRTAPVDMDGLAREVMQELLADVRHRKIETRIAPLPAADADGALLRQVFVNLFSNAIKYTRPRAAALIEVGTRAEAGGHVYFVKDNGVGFDMKHASKLFGVFQRLHRADEFEGTGVGLALVQRIIHRHGGRVWGEGVVDQGATFSFSLPSSEKPT